MAPRTRSLDADVQNVALRSLESLDTPIALGVYLRLKYARQSCDWVELASMSIDPLQYLDSPWTIDRFRRDYQAISLLRKFEALPIKKKDRKCAFEAFIENERMCCKTNFRLTAFDHPIGIDCAVLKLLHRVRKICNELLGRVPDNLLQGGFGKKAVFEFDGQHDRYHKNLCGKIMTPIHCTAAATDVVELLVRPTKWGQYQLTSAPSQSALRILRGNRFTTVPKDALKDRGICVEPGGNMFCQLAVGRHLRSRLFRVAGLDIVNAQPLHQSMSRVGSLTGKYATIDLSNASDTISTKFVELALGYSDEWLLLLRSLRSPMTRVKGTWNFLEKFSSMGNGYTFELETLLFYSLALAATGRYIGDPDVKVYGDDIIVPTEDASKVLDVLTLFGFTANPRKTYTTGPFRESCGGDFFMGEEVTPLYLKKNPTTPADWITVANGLYCRPSLKKVGLFARRFIGLPKLPYGPRYLGDIVVAEDDRSKYKFVTRPERKLLPGEVAKIDYICPQVRWIKAWVPIPRLIPLERYDGRVVLAAALYGCDSSGVSPYNDPVEGYKFSYVAVS